MSRQSNNILRLTLAAVGALALLTVASVSTPSLDIAADTRQLLDRNNIPLTATYQARWNTQDMLPLHDAPAFLTQAFIVSEDKRFYEHAGIDWRARGSALWQNASSRDTVRGASTITEQVVRMAHPRKRNLWSKWVETFEAYLLETKYSKPQILEFYLNQLPYAANRRGIVQAARYYFDRDLATLTKKEMLALAVLARAPSGYDLYRKPERIEGPLARLAGKMGMADDIAGQKITLSRPALPADARHFAQFVRAHDFTAGKNLRTTLDTALQGKAQRILDDRVRALAGKSLHNAALLVADHTTGEIVAWAVAGGEDTPAREINAVTVPRQPGSALKPFLYASALDKDWTAATILDDSPVAEAVGTGLHKFKNYSNVHYGRITLREALANSLNIPAVLTVQHVGAAHYLSMLRKLGFDTLDRGAEIYDDGLALGVGEVSLFELVQGYAALANKGVFRPLSFIYGEAGQGEGRRVFSPETASLIGNILSDPHARRHEFGAGSVLNLPVQTAVKTGTSTDYRDAWVIGYNDRYVAGIWMGNLDHRPTDGVTGATGPALALRAIFSELNKNRDTKRLWLSPKLVRRDVCIEDAHDASRCYMRPEYFAGEVAEKKETTQRFELVKPTDGLQMAIDPRVPQELQKFEFALRGLRAGQSVEWILNGENIGVTKDRFLWPLAYGKYKLEARVMEGGRIVKVLPPATYVVK